MLGRASGRHLHALAHNRDPRPVQVGRRRRSIGSQRALGRRAEVARRRSTPRWSRSSTASPAGMRAAGRVGRTVVLRLRFDDFSRATRSHTLSRATAQTRDDPRHGARLLAAAMPLIEQPGPHAGRHRGRATSTTTAPSSSTLPFDDRRRAARSTSALDEVRDRFGTERDHPRPCCSAAIRACRCRCSRTEPAGTISGVTTLEMDTPARPGARASAPRRRSTRRAGARSRRRRRRVRRETSSPRATSRSRGRSAVVLVEQPYRVAGRRSPPPARAARRRLDRGGRAAARGRAARPAADHRRPLLGCARRLPHGRGDRRRRRALPGLPAPAAAARAAAGAEPAARARGGDRADADRAGRARPVRHAAGRRAAAGRGRAGRPQPEDGRAGWSPRPWPVWLGGLGVASGRCRQPADQLQRARSSRGTRSRSNTVAALVSRKVASASRPSAANASPRASSVSARSQPAPSSWKPATARSRRTHAASASPAASSARPSRRSAWTGSARSRAPLRGPRACSMIPGPRSRCPPRRSACSALRARARGRCDARPSSCER